MRQCRSSGCLQVPCDTCQTPAHLAHTHGAVSTGSRPPVQRRLHIPLVTGHHISRFRSTLVGVDVVEVIGKSTVIHVTTVGGDDVIGGLPRRR